MRRPLTKDEAEACYDILVEEAGARDDNNHHRHPFVHYVTQPRAIEYRFMGELGFGGKFYCGDYCREHPHVGCYGEDRTPERAAIIERVNAKLAVLFAPAPEREP